MRVCSALAAAALLAAPAVAIPPVANPFNAQLLKLSLIDRNGALRRAVTNENQRCGRLSDSVYRGPFGNLGYWQAHCTPGGDYAIFVGGNGTTQTRPCADLKSLKLPACTASPTTAAKK